MHVMAIDFFSVERGQVIDLRPTQTERLVGRLFEVFDLACDNQDAAAAQDILQAARTIMARAGLPQAADRDRTAQLLVDAHYRLWELRNIRK